jgi:hypothetical protein
MQVFRRALRPLLQQTALVGQEEHCLLLKIGEKSHMAQEQQRSLWLYRQTVAVRPLLQQTALLGQHELCLQETTLLLSMEISM